MISDLLQFAHLSRLLVTASESMEHKTLLYSVFGGIIALFLIVDLGFLNRKAHKISFRSALLQTLFWVSISLSYGVLLYYYYAPERALEYYTGYLTEYALSMDNIFVIILILRYFKIEEKYHHGVLFWGILGAVVMRGIFIFLGAILIAKFSFILYLFGVFLLYSGIKMLVQKDGGDEIDPEKNFVMRFARKYFRLTTESHGGKFFVRKNGLRHATPLFMVLLLIESTDLIFAVDSIPAIMVITQDQLILYTSNIFAVMGLRAMFFLLSNVLDKFYLLHKGLSLVLIFIGMKMLLTIFHNVESLAQYEWAHYFKIPTWVSLTTIAAILFGSVILSLVFPKKQTGEKLTVDDPTTPVTEQ
ncbi:MAG: TerC family protein [Bacteroidota bacterium]